jgi:hypothetical protein
MPEHGMVEGTWLPAPPQDSLLAPMHAAMHAAALRKRKIPAFLHAGAVESLVPTDPLRIRLVADDREVRKALRLASAAYEAVLRALASAADSPEARDAHVNAVREHQAILRNVLKPAVLVAELRQLAAIRHRNLRALASSAVRRVDDDRIRAVFALLRRHPNWSDRPALWSQPEIRPYVSRSVITESAWRARRELKAQRTALPRSRDLGRAAAEAEKPGDVSWALGDRQSPPAERELEQCEGAEARMRRLAEALERYRAPAALRKALEAVIERDLSIADALRLAGVERSVFENWVDRVQRGRQKDLTSRAPKTGRKGGVGT